MKEDSDREIAARIFRYCDLENKKVLEIGCGDGRITVLIQDKPREFIALDPDEEIIRQAGMIVPGVEFRVGSGENLDFPDGHFDLVVFTLSLHHQQSRLALGEAVRVLRKGGRVVIVEPRNGGEVGQVFGLLRNEEQAVLEARKAIEESGLQMEHSEEFTARWSFKDGDELLQSLFAYEGLEFDPAIARQVADLLGENMEARPIVLTEKLIIQTLRKLSF